MSLTDQRTDGCVMRMPYRAPIARGAIFGKGFAESLMVGTTRSHAHGESGHAWSREVTSKLTIES